MANETASLIALRLDLRETIDSGSSKGGGRYSDSRPRGPSGEPCIEELFVVSCVVSGDMTGDACCELEATEEALMADAGTEFVEPIVGRKEVWTWLGFARLIVEEDCCRGCCCGVVVVVEGGVGNKEGLEFADIITDYAGRRRIAQ